MDKISKLKKGRAVLLMLLPIFFLTVGLNVQNLNIKGKVIDSDGNVLSGAAARIQGSAAGVTTNNDGDGDYVLNNVPGGSIFEFSLVGYATQEIKVTGDKTVINTILIEESQSLDEITVVTSAKQKKESMIGAITSVNTKELKVPLSNLTTVAGSERCVDLHVITCYTAALRIRLNQLHKIYNNYDCTG
jgi:hypothetical protein